MFNSGIRGRRARDGEGTVNSSEQFIQQQFSVPYVSRFAITNGSYVDSNNTSADPAGGETIVLYGSGFRSGATVLVGSTTIAVVTVLDNNRITFTSPALSSGSYTVYVTNSNGGTGILVPGIIYSAMPAFTTAAGSIGSYYETTAISNTIVATEGADPITYSLFSGSLPSGATLYGNGAIIGTAPVESASTTYTFTIQATDSEFQDSTRQFSLTINTDVVTWNTPLAGNLEVTNDTLISNITLSALSAAGYTISSYSANALPTGLTLSGNIISGTPTGYTQNTTISAVLTANAATTGRSGTRSITWVVNVQDFFLNTVPVVLQGNSEDSFLKDKSSNNYTVAPTGDISMSEMSPYWPGGWSAYFDGTGDYLTVPDSTAFTMGADNFTLEAWVYVTAVSGSQMIFGTSDSAGTQGSMSFILYAQNGSGFPSIGVGYAGTVYYATSSETLTKNQWNHIAGVRNGATVSIYVNGISRGTLNMAALAITDSSQVVAIGRNGNFNGEYLTGYISNARIVKGTALYTANFTPETTSLTTVANTSLLTLRGSTLTDDSPNNFTITRNGDVKLKIFSPFNSTPHTITANSYSVSFDGTGDYLVIPNQDALNLGTGNFTFECWIYWTDPNNIYKGIFGKRASNVGWTMALSNTDPCRMLFYISGSGNNIASAGDIYRNTWYHLAWVRNSGTITYYLNGQSVATLTNNVSNNSYDTSIGISQNVGSLGEVFGGIISNARFVKGTAVYTANFTPSTTPLTAVANTSLLTCQSATISDNSSNNFAISVNGDARPRAINPFGETTTSVVAYSPTTHGGSAYFDGTGDIATVQTLTAGSMGTSDLTIECWFYPTATKTFAQIIGNRSSASGNTGFVPICVSFETSNTIKYYSSSNGSSWNLNNATTIGTVVLFTWNHVAISRVGSSCLGFLNGSRVTLSSSYSGVNYTATNLFYASGADNFQGYISNYRLVIGEAIYTLTSTMPSTSALTTTANTKFLTLQNAITSSNYDVIDRGTFRHPLRRFGDATQGSYSPYIPSGWSAYFDGNGDYLSVAHNTALNLSSGNFTIEGWFYCTALAGNQQILNKDGQSSVSYPAYSVFINSSGVLRAELGNGASTSPTSTVYIGTTVTLNTWNHFALVKSGTTISIYQNGLQTVSTSQGVAITDGGKALLIGYQTGQPSNQYFNGFISNLRIIKGTARYSANFTPSTSTTNSVDGTSLMLFNGPSLVDNGPYIHSITRNGDVAVSPFSPFNSHSTTPNTYSVFFDGTGDYLTLPSNAAFGFGTGNFTIEGWFYFTGTISTYQRPWWFGDDNDNLEISSSTFRVGGATQGTLITGATAVANQWYHIAVTRSSGSYRLFINGNQSGSTASNSYNSSTRTFAVMATSAGANPSTGYVSNLRILKGTAQYTANFTPSTTALTSVANTSVLICQSTTIIDNSTNNFTITATGNVAPTVLNPFGYTTTTPVAYNPTTHGGSVYFDGTGDYLTVPGLTHLESIGSSMSSTSTFTVEAWVYLYAFSAYIVGDMDPGGASNTWSMHTTASGQLNFYWWDGAAKNATGHTLMPLKSWHHLAVSINSGTISLFVNGIKQAIAGTSTLSAGSAYNNLSIGRYNSDSTRVFGYVSGLRILRGTARYTSSFLPSASAPTSENVASLLLNFTDASIYDSVAKSNWVSVNDAKSSSTIKKYGTGSMYFDGTDYIYAASATGSPEFVFGTGDFTIEFWIYFNAVTANAGILDFRNQLTNGNYVNIYISTNKIAYYHNSADRILSDVVSTGQWYHVVLCRASTNTRMFINGVKVGSTYVDSSSHVVGANRPSVASSGYQLGTNLCDAYIDDLRISKGYAKFTSDASFTPPQQHIVQ